MDVNLIANLIHEWLQDQDERHAYIADIDGLAEYIVSGTTAEAAS